MVRLLLLPMLIVASPAAADDRVTYNSGLLGDTYKDKKVGDHSWTVKTIIRISKPPSSAEKMAMYRAAELTLSDGRTVVRMDNSKSDVLRVTTAGAGQAFSFNHGYSAELTFTATNEAAATGHCGKDIALACTTFDAAQALVEFRPFLKFKGEK